MVHLPFYKSGSDHIKDADLFSLLSCNTIQELENLTYPSNISEINSSSIIHYFKSRRFFNYAEVVQKDELYEAMNSLVKEMFKTATKFGFPEITSEKKSSIIDNDLAVTLAESLERFRIQILPAEATFTNFQRFFTQRLIPHLIYWRWKTPAGNINQDRFISQSRNYFYSLWALGWLFDKGKNENYRWEYLQYINADNLVQIIERPEIGLRKGFTHAIAREMQKRRENPSDYNYNPDLVLRGAMKRATFTFATSVILDNSAYYDSIVQYLFRWSENNYFVKSDKKSDSDYEDT